MNINWKARLKNKAFWVAFIPALFLLVQTLAAIFGIQFDTSEITSKVITAVDALFVVLTILGIAVDPTTEGICDSAKALTYKEPAPNVRNENL